MQGKLARKKPQANNINALWATFRGSPYSHPAKTPSSHFNHFLIQSEKQGVGLYQANFGRSGKQLPMEKRFIHHHWRKPQ